MVFDGPPNARSKLFPKRRAPFEDLRTRYSDAPWADIIAIGNPLRHEYHRIDDKVLWETATVDLPELQPIILRMLEGLES